MKTDGLGVAFIGAGIVISFSGLKNQTLAATLSAFLHGQDPADLAEPSPVLGVASGAGSGTAGGTAAGGGLSTPGGGSDAANRALGKLMAGGYGWATGAEWTALDHGWGTLESGWNNEIYFGGQIGGAYKPGLAYGIPAFLGHGSSGAPYPDGSPANPPGAGGTSSATSQIAQGLAYIKGKYGSPTGVPGWTGGPYSGY